VANLWSSAAAATLAVHLAWLLFVIFGAFVTRGRPMLAGVHIGSLLWGVAVEAGPWACPLTVLEQHLRVRAGLDSFTEPFLVHYLDRLVYPDIAPGLLTGGAVVVCALNLGVYIARGRAIWAARYKTSRATPSERE
jgi:hypothetical protein